MRMTWERLPKHEAQHCLDAGCGRGGTAFPDQQAALNALRVAAKPHAILCIFDYVDRGGFGDTAFARKAETLLWRPLCLASLPARLGATGWLLKTCVEINSEYNQSVRATGRAIR